MVEGPVGVGGALASPSPAPVSVPKVQGNIGDTPKTPLHDHASEIIAEQGDPAQEGLSWVMKLGLIGVILAVCYGWIRAHSPHGSGSGGSVPAGRHGAYEKTGVA